MQTDFRSNISLVFLFVFSSRKLSVHHSVNQFTLEKHVSMLLWANSMLRIAVVCKFDNEVSGGCCLCKVTEIWHIPLEHLCLWSKKGNGFSWLEQVVICHSEKNGTIINGTIYNDKRVDFHCFNFFPVRQAAELKLTKSTHVYAFGCLKTRCTRLLMTSSVPHLSLFVNWNGSSAPLTSSIFWSQFFQDNSWQLICNHFSFHFFL